MRLSRRQYKIETNRTPIETCIALLIGTISNDLERPLILISTQLNLLIYGSSEAGLNKHREHIIKHKA